MYKFLASLIMCMMLTFLIMNPVSAASISDVDKSYRFHDDIKKLFRPDVNTVEIGKPESKGSGLGLILCKEFIDKHKGKIFARRNVDKGCTFGFVIPKN